MKNLICVNNQELSVKEYNEYRVVTFKDIDKVHGRPDGTARKRFAENRNKFIENEDFFFVKPESIQKSEKRTFEIPPRGMILLTQTGYLMLAKSLTDDLAWEVQRQLVNNYFNNQMQFNQPKQKKLPDAAYTYKPKYYKGQLVVSFYDLEHFTGITAHTYRYYLKQYADHFVKGKDYWYLVGAEMVEFKKQNGYTKYCNSLLVVSKSGFVKLAKLMRGVPKELECFKVVDEKKPDGESLRNDMHDLIDSIYSELEAVRVLVKKIDRYNTNRESELLRGALGPLGDSLSARLVALSSFDVSGIKGNILGINAYHMPIEERESYYKKRGFYEAQEKMGQEPLAMLSGYEDENDAYLTVFK